MTGCHRLHSSPALNITTDLFVLHSVAPILLRELASQARPVIETGHQPRRTIGSGGDSPIFVMAIDVSYQRIEDQVTDEEKYCIEAFVFIGSSDLMFFQVINDRVETRLPLFIENIVVKLHLLHGFISVDELLPSVVAENRSRQSSEFNLTVVSKMSS